MKLIEKKINSNTVYDGKILKFHVDEVELPDGRHSYRECVSHSGGAAVLLVRDGKVLLVKQYRYVYGKEIYEIPAGKLNAGEDPKKAASRELEEETGFKASLVHMFDLYPTPGYTDEVIYVYFAKDCEFVGQKLDEGEFLNCEFIDLEKVVEMIGRGEICDAKTVAAVYRYLAVGKN